MTWLQQIAKETSDLESVLARLSPEQRQKERRLAETTVGHTPMSAALAVLDEGGSMTHDPTAAETRVARGHSMMPDGGPICVRQIRCSDSECKALLVRMATTDGAAKHLAEWTAEERGWGKVVAPVPEPVFGQRAGDVRFLCPECWCRYRGILDAIAELALKQAHA
jgi:hypothetical protein